MFGTVDIHMYAFPSEGKDELNITLGDLNSRTLEAGWPDLHV